MVVRDAEGFVFHHQAGAVVHTRNPHRRGDRTLVQRGDKGRGEDARHARRQRQRSREGVRGGGDVLHPDIA